MTSIELLIKFRSVINSCVTKEQYLFAKKYGELLKRKIKRDFKKKEANLVAENIDYYIKKVDILNRN
jgi:hypothetical protein